MTGTGWPGEWMGSALTPIDADTAFNGYLAAQLIYALDRLELLDELAGEGRLDIRAAAARTGADEFLLRELLRAAAACGYVVLRDETAVITAAGREIARMRGYFTWAVGGYAALFASTAGIVSGERRFRHEVFRDEAMVALGSGQNDQALMAGIVDDVLKQIESTIIADLGSGIASRLCRVASSREGIRGLGLDISGAATQLAVENVIQAGLDETVQVLQADVLALTSGGERYPVLAEVDAVMSFFLLHDLLADPARRPRVMPSLREAFPEARTFVLADTMLRPAEPGRATLPVFSVGYELAHALMGVPLYTRDTYETLFTDAGLRVRQVLPFGTPHSWLWVLRAG